MLKPKLSSQNDALTQAIFKPKLSSQNDALTQAILEPKLSSQNDALTQAIFLKAKTIKSRRWSSPNYLQTKNRFQSVLKKKKLKPKIYFRPIKYSKIKK